MAYDKHSDESLLPTTLIQSPITLPEHASENGSHTVCPSDIPSDIYSRLAYDFEHGEFSADKSSIPCGTTIDVERITRELDWYKTLQNLQTLHYFTKDVIGTDVGTSLRVFNPLTPHPKSAVLIKTYLPRLAQMSMVFPSVLKFSQEVELFLTLYRRTDLEEQFRLYESAWLKGDEQERKQLNISIRQTLNSLMLTICQYGNNANFKKRAWDRMAKSRDRLVVLRKYVNDLFAKHARLLVLRIDLHYALESTPEMSLDAIRASFQRFLTNQRHNQLFNTVKGYIWFMECGDERGIHYHLMLFLDGDRSRKHEYIAQKIGEYWKKITDGKGTFHNCNREKHRYKHLGIGMIHRNDLEKRAVISNRMLPYHCKMEQVLTVRDVNTMGRGQIS